MRWQFMTIGAGLSILFIALVMLFSNTANAGQTGGFCSYAKEAVIKHLDNVYGKGGNPYKVTCSEKDSSHVPVHDTLTIRITQ